MVISYLVMGDKMTKAELADVKTVYGNAKNNPDEPLPARVSYGRRNVKWKMKKILKISGRNTIKRSISKNRRGSSSGSQDKNER